MAAIDDVALLRWIKARYAPMLDRCLRHPRVVAARHAARGRTVARACAARRQRLHAAARRRRVPAADGAADRGVARGSRSPEPPGRGHPPGGARGRRRRAPDRPSRAHGGPDAAHGVGRAGDAEGRSRARSGRHRGRHARAARARLPGIAVLFTTPLGMRIDEGLGGTPADISVRVFGPDLDELARLAEEAETHHGRAWRA